MWLYQKHEHRYAIPRISVLPRKEVQKLSLFYLKIFVLLNDTAPEVTYQKRKYRILLKETYANIFNNEAAAQV